MIWCIVAIVLLWVFWPRTTVYVDARPREPRDPSPPTLPPLPERPPPAMARVKSIWRDDISKVAVFELECGCIGAQLVLTEQRLALVHKDPLQCEGCGREVAPWA